MRSPLETGPLVVLDSVDSTQNHAAVLLRQGSPVGAVLSLEQTAGRGRFGRPWSSPPGQCLAVSLIFEPHPRPYLLGMALAVACAEAFGCQASWPNDVVAAGRKLGGILTEMLSDAQEQSRPVVGVGLNLSNAALPPELAETATSLESITARLWTPQEALDAILGRFILIPTLTSWQDLASRWKAVDATPGKQYRLQDGRVGSAMRVGEEGELICEVEGIEQSVLAADALLGATPASK